MRDYSRLDAFLESLIGDVYPEVPAEPHLQITRSTIEALHGEGLIKAGDRVLDIGCGQGIALAQFQRLGMTAVGLTLGSDCQVCRDKGFEAYEMDQNFIAFESASFDFLWCRHVLEHSIAPLFTLSEYHRLVKPGGRVYVEVPAPDTSAHHETNPNHYSVLTASAWLSLFPRAGFTVLRHQVLNFTLRCGPDSYYSFLLQRP